MRTILLQSGATMLQTQVGGSAKLYITAFKAGDRPATQAEMETWDYNEIALTSMQGNIVVSLDNTYMSFINGGNNNKGKVSCLIPNSVPEIVISNIVIYAGFNANGSDKQPFCFSASDVAVTKIQTTLDSAGYDYIFNIMLNFSDLYDRFDFSNLSTVVPEWFRPINENYLQPAYVEGHDQIVLNSHTEYGGHHPVINVANRYYGCPLLADLSSIMSTSNYVLDGGVAGDGQL